MGIEPITPILQGSVAPLEHVPPNWQQTVAVLSGLEPKRSGPEPLMLPLHHSTVVEVRFELTKPKRLIYSQVPLSTWVLHSTTLCHSSA